jgi:predicted tellurium resistance membrane protein TerC
MQCSGAEEFALSNLSWIFAEPVLAAGGVTIDPSNGWVGLAVALIALSAMEIVLGIDNIVFISIATNKLPEEQRKKARLTGLALAMGFRILLLCFIAAIASWIKPLFQLDQLLPSFLHYWVANSTEINEVSARDLILFFGGLFLVYQSVREIHHLTEVSDESGAPSIVRTPSYGSVLMQIALLDIVFSLDSVITAVGMVDNIPVMIAAVMISVIVMMVFSGPVSAFVTRHPSVKVLALSFLLMIGVMLVAEGFGSHFNKNYIYFAMAFSLGVELLNLRIRRKSANAY